MPDRPRHQRKDYERVLRSAEARGWRVERDAGYFKCFCPCAEQHIVRVVLTPSRQRTLINTAKSFERCTCWSDEEL